MLLGRFGQFVDRTNSLELVYGRGISNQSPQMRTWLNREVQDVEWILLRLHENYYLNGIPNSLPTHCKGSKEKTTLLYTLQSVQGENATQNT